MAKAQKAIPSHGASNAFKGIKQGTSFGVNGCAGSFNKQKVNSSSASTDPTMESKTIKGSSSISQHKRMAMNGN